MVFALIVMLRARNRPETPRSRDEGKKGQLRWRHVKSNFGRSLKRNCQQLISKTSQTSKTQQHTSDTAGSQHVT